MGYSYDSLATLVNETTDAAIESTLAMMRFYGTCGTGFTGSSPSGDPIHISPLGGAYEGSTFVTGGQVTDPITGYPAIVPIEPGWPFRDLQGLISYYNSTVPGIFEDWLMLPDPVRMQGQVDQAKSAAKTLAFSAQFGTGPGVKPWGPNTNLDGDIDMLDTRVATLEGDAMWTFQQEVTSRLGPVVAAQDACACLLYITSAGEQMIWQRARQSVADIAGQALEAMKKARGDGGGGLEALLTVVGAVALIAAPFTGGLSEAAAAGVNAVGVAMQTAGTFVHEGEPEKIPLGASNPLSVIDNIVKALDQLNSQIKREETGLQNGMSRISSLIPSQQHDFDLGVPALLNDDNPAHFNSIKVQHDTLTRLSTLITTGISPELRSASNAMDASLDAGVWQRPASIGVGSDGPYSDYDVLCLETSGLVSRGAAFLDDSAHVLDVVARDFRSTDAKISADLSAQTTKVDKSVTPY